MKIQLEDGVWLTDGQGDPPRTLVEDNAKDFLTMEEAVVALGKAREFRPFLDAEFVDSFF